MRVLLLVASLLAAGCFGHCGYSRTEAEWQDLSLYEELDAPVQEANGVPVNVPGVAIGSISVRLHDFKLSHGNAYVRYQGALIGHVEEGRDAGALAEASRILLENATTLHAAAITREVESFLASGETRQDRYRYAANGSERVNVTYYRHGVLLDGDLLLQNMGFNGTMEPLEHGRISASFVPHWKETILDDYRLRVDAWGGAKMHHDWSEATDEEVEADVQRVMSAHGLPAPARVAVDGVVC